MTLGQWNGFIFFYITSCCNILIKFDFTNFLKLIMVQIHQNLRASETI